MTRKAEAGTAPVAVAHVDRIEAPGSSGWKPIRHHFGVRGFGVNAYVAARAGDEVIETHRESAENGSRHEELYVVLRGRARFLVGAEEIDAPAGALVFVRDPDLTRGARAVDPDTVVLAIGGEPGAPYRISPWELAQFPADTVPPT